MNESSVVVQEIERVPIENALSLAWQGTKKKFLLLFTVLLLSTVFCSVPTLVAVFGGEALSKHLLVWLLLTLYGAVAASVTWLGCIKLALHINRDQPFALDDFLSVGALLPSFWVVCIVRTIIVVLGYLCFIVPGVILHIKLDQADYFLVDRKTGPIAAMDASWRVTNGSILMLFLFGLIMQFVQFIGWCALLIGAIPAYMEVMLAKGLYLRESRQHID